MTSTCPLDSTIATTSFMGIYNCFIRTGIVDVAGLWNTGGAFYSYLNYSYNVPLPGTNPSQTWFTLYFGINHRWVLYSAVWAVLFTFWATIYVVVWAAKIY